ncbi:MAG TPA: hypothetical protein VFA81_04170, partial [Burkholderiales bacterium]|nr:hypothetical protein [Burkholderiales bacterium]
MKDLAMRRSLLLLAACSMSALAADEWIEVGADTEAKYYVNKSTVEFDGDTVRFQKRAIYTKPLADNFT